MKTQLNIKVLNNINGDKLPWADYRSDLKLKKFNDFKQLKDWLYVAAIGKVSLKYVDTRTKKPVSYEVDVESELFGAFHMDWLLEREADKNKYLELESLDYRIINSAA